MELLVVVEKEKVPTASAQWCKFPQGTTQKEVLYSHKKQDAQ